MKCGLRRGVVQLPQRESVRVNTRFLERKIKLDFLMKIININITYLYSMNKIN